MFHKELRVECDEICALLDETTTLLFLRKAVVRKASSDAASAIHSVIHERIRCACEANVFLFFDGSFKTPKQYEPTCSSLSGDLCIDQ